MNEVIIFELLILHFIADFVLQSNKVAQNKSKSNLVLLKHVTIYSIPFVIIGWQYAILNGVLHFIVDYFTSRGTSKLWAKGEVHWFFVLIGFDQLLHYSILYGTYLMMY